MSLGGDDDGATHIEVTDDPRDEYYDSLDLA